MDLKLAKVLSWLQKNMDGEVSMTEDTISTVCNDVADALRKQFASSTNRREFKARPSNLGKPLCQLQMEKKGEKGVSPSYNFILRMMVGDVVEAILKGVIKEANLEGSETVLALTNDDENNMMVCVLAEKTGLKKRTIAIVNKTNYNLLQDSLNIDDLVDPRMTTVSRIMEHVHKGTIGTVYSLLDGEYEFIEAKISEKSELINKKIRDSNLPEDIRIGAIIRKEQVIIPRSSLIFEKDDLVVFLAKREELKAVENIFSVGAI